MQLDPHALGRSDSYSKSALKANFSRDELKLMKKEQKRLQREAISLQAEQLLGASVSAHDGAPLSRRAAVEAIKEHNVQRSRKLVRISSAITGATIALALWWLVIAASTPVRSEHRSLSVIFSFPLWVFVLFVVGLTMRYKHATSRDARMHYYRAYPLFQLPPLRAFVAMLTLHMCYRAAVLLDGGALSLRLNPPDPAKVAALPPYAHALDISLAVLIPTVLSVGLILPLLVALPMHAANEKLGGFSEVKQFQFYLGISFFYAVSIGALTIVRWLTAATDARGTDGQGP